MKLFCDQCKKVFSTDLQAGTAEKAVCPECKKEIAVPQEFLAPGCVLGDFLLEKELSHGGMGRVFLARQISLDRPVALKVLHEKFAHNKEYVEGLFHEARAAAKLTHPNIVQAYAVGEEEGIYYFAMEYIKGETFKQILKKEKKLPFEQAAKVIKEIAGALQAAWNEQKLVHQDIKPDNIMLDGNGFAKLSDLGLARKAGSSDQVNEDDTEVMGTPQYISPEQLTGIPTDVRSDIYSLGATFYQFVTGQFPYPGKDAEEMAKLHVEGNLTPPKEINSDLPNELNTIICKMMARHISDRYQTPEELIADLEKYLTKPAMPKVTLNLKLPTTSRPLLKATLSKPAVPPVKAAPAAKPAVPPAKPAEEKKSETPAKEPEKKPAEEKKGPVPEQQTAETKQELTPDELKQKKKQKIKLLIKISAAVVVVLLIAGAGTFCFLGVKGKLPGAMQSKVNQLITSLKKMVTPDKAREAAAAQARAKEAQEQLKQQEERKAKKEAENRENTIVNTIDQLLSDYRSNPANGKAFLKKADKIFTQYFYIGNRYHRPHTEKEQNAVARLNETYALVDEQLRAAPAREKRRTDFLKKYEARINDAENKKLEAKKHAEEALKKKQEQEVREAENRRMAAEDAAVEKNRQQKLFSDLNAQKKKIIQGFVNAVQGDEETLNNALNEAKNLELPSSSKTKMEQAAWKEFQTFQKEIPPELKKIQRFKAELESLSGKISVQVKYKKETVYVISIKPLKIRTLITREEAEIAMQDLTSKNRKKIFDDLRNRITTVPKASAVFYYDLIRKQISRTGQKEIPAGFWKKYFKFIEPQLKKVNY